MRDGGLANPSASCSSVTACVWRLVSAAHSACCTRKYSLALRWAISIKSRLAPRRGTRSSTLEPRFSDNHASSTSTDVSDEISPMESSVSSLLWGSACTRINLGTKTALS